MEQFLVKANHYNFSKVCQLLCFLPFKIKPNVIFHKLVTDTCQATCQKPTTTTREKPTNWCGYLSSIVDANASLKIK